MSGIRRAAERLSLRSESNTSHAEQNAPKHTEAGAVSESYDDYPGSFGHRVQRDSGTTIAEVPLVHLGSKGAKTMQTEGGVKGDDLEAASPENGKVFRGLDAV